MPKKNRQQSKGPIHTNIDPEKALLTSTQKPHPFKLILAALLLIISAWIVYNPSLKVPFLLDDYGKIIRNPDIKSLDNIPSRLIYPYESSFNFHRNDPSRPLTYLTFTLNYHFSQLEPYGYHVVNIGLHVIVVLLIFALASLIFPLVGITGISPPFLSALLFAVHPLNLNVVTYIIGRAASLATIFYLLAVIMFIQARRGIKFGIAVSAVCFIFALASNQLALTLPAVFLITDFCFFSGKDSRRVMQNWKQHGIFWGILAFYFGMRLAYFGKLGDIEAAHPIDQTKYLLTQLVVLWKYVGMIFLPIGLSFEHLYGPLEHFTDQRVLAAIALYGILLEIIFKSLKSPSQKISLGIFDTFWFFITLSPTSSVFPTTATMAENRLYLPSIGICLIIVLMGYALINRILPARLRAAVLIIIISSYSAVLGSITINHNLLYQNPVAIWKDVIRRYPDHERAHQNLALEYFKQEKFNEMAEECEKALALNPGNLEVRNNLASAYYNLHRYSDALVTYQQILKEEPDFAPAYANMGLVYEQLSKRTEAIAAYQNAIRINPALIEPLGNLGNLYAQEGNLREASAMYQAALRVDPHNKQILEDYEKISPHRP